MTLAKAPSTQSVSHTSSPDVSIIIAARNAEGFIGNALFSALGQRDVELEVIVVDDASTDRTAAITEEYTRTDPRVRLVRGDEHRGPGPARNRGLEVARGRWIAILDADDRFQVSRLSVLIAVAREHDADLVADNLWLVDSVSGVPFSLMLYPATYGKATVVTAEGFVKNNNPNNIKRKYGLLKPIIKKEFLDRHKIWYDEEAFYGEDFLFYLECLLRDARFVLIPEAYYLYTLSSVSLTRTRSLRQAAVFLKRCDALLERDEVRTRPTLMRALSNRSRQLRSDLVYLDFIGSLKQGRIRHVARTVARRPKIAPYIVRHVLNVAMLRMRQLIARKIAPPTRRLATGAE